MIFDRHIHLHYACGRAYSLTLKFVGRVYNVVVCLERGEWVEWTWGSSILAFLKTTVFPGSGIPDWLKTAPWTDLL